MFKHKKVRKIAKYTLLFSFFNTAFPLISASYAQNEIKKELKTPNDKYNLGENMAPVQEQQPINIPNHIEELTQISFLRDLKVEIETAYTNLMAENTEQQAFNKIIYAIFKSMEPGTPGNHFIRKGEITTQINAIRKKEISNKKIEEECERTDISSDAWNRWTIISGFYQENKISKKQSSVGINIKLDQTTPEQRETAEQVIISRIKRLQIRVDNLLEKFDRVIEWRELFNRQNSNELEEIIKDIDALNNDLIKQGKSTKYKLFDFIYNNNKINPYLKSFILEYSKQYTLSLDTSSGTGKQFYNILKNAYITFVNLDNYLFNIFDNSEPLTDEKIEEIKEKLEEISTGKENLDIFALNLILNLNYGKGCEILINVKEKLIKDLEIEWPNEFELHGGNSPLLIYHNFILGLEHLKNNGINIDVYFDIIKTTQSEIYSDISRMKNTEFFIDGDETEILQKRNWDAVSILYFGYSLKTNDELNILLEQKRIIVETEFKFTTEYNDLIENFAQGNNLENNEVIHTALSILGIVEGIVNDKINDEDFGFLDAFNAGNFEEFEFPGETNLGNFIELIYYGMYLRYLEKEGVDDTKQNGLNFIKSLVYEIQQSVNYPFLHNLSEIYGGYKILALDQEVITEINKTENSINIYDNYLFYFKELMKKTDISNRYEALILYNQEITKSIDIRSGLMEYMQQRTLNIGTYGFDIRNPEQMIIDMGRIPRFYDIFNQFIPHINYDSPLESRRNVQKFINSTTTTRFPGTRGFRRNLELRIRDDVFEIHMRTAYNNVLKKYTPVSQLSPTYAEAALSGAPLNSDIGVRFRGDTESGGILEGGMKYEKQRRYSVGSSEIWRSNDQNIFDANIEAQNLRVLGGELMRNFTRIIIDERNRYNNEGIKTEKIDDTELIQILDYNREILNSEVIIISNIHVREKTTQDLEENLSNREYNHQLANRIYIKRAEGWFIITDRHFMDKFNEEINLQKDQIFLRLGILDEKINAGVEHLGIDAKDKEGTRKNFGFFVGGVLDNDTADILGIDSSLGMLGAKSKEDEGVLLYAKTNEDKNKFFSVGVFALNDTEWNYHSNVPLEEIASEDYNYYVSFDKLILNEMRGSGFMAYEDKEETLRLGGSYQTKQIGLGLILRPVGNGVETHISMSVENWRFLDSGNIYYRNLDETEEWGSVFTIDLGNGNLLDIYAINQEDLTQMIGQTSGNTNKRIGEIMGIISETRESWKNDQKDTNDEHYQDKILTQTQELFRILQTEYPYLFTGKIQQYAIRWRNDKGAQIKLAATKITKDDKEEMVFSGNIGFNIDNFKIDILCSVPCFAGGRIQKENWGNLTLAVVGNPTRGESVTTIAGENILREGDVGAIQATTRNLEGREPQYKLALLYGGKKITGVAQYDYKKMRGDIDLNTHSIGAGLLLSGAANLSIYGAYIATTSEEEFIKNMRAFQLGTSFYIHGFEVRGDITHSPTDKGVTKYGLYLRYWF